jgi:hypothetical protein
VDLIELDEQWNFIAKKQRHVQTGDPEECGDARLFAAVKRASRAKWLNLK